MKIIYLIYFNYNINNDSHKHEIIAFESRQYAEEIHSILNEIQSELHEKLYIKDRNAKLYLDNSFNDFIFNNISDKTKRKVIKHVDIFNSLFAIIDDTIEMWFYNGRVSFVEHDTYSFWIKEVGLIENHQGKL